METVACVQTTIRVPSTLYERARQLVEQGAAESVNQFIVTALENRVNRPRARGFGECSGAGTNSEYGNRSGAEDPARCDFDVIEEFGE